MYNNKEVRFGDDYFFQEQEFGTAALVSEAFQLGVTHGGIRVHGWTVGVVECADGATVVSKLQVADSADADDWKDIAVQTATASGTSFSGDLFSFIPDVDAKFMRVSVSNSTGVTGKFSFAPEFSIR